ncbi:hypothetical protein BDR04DRAFT_744886 [Suillus decipiens]|nr:hypothetical protein BDR04DRAFT_744886 [Suillus decipiens]
MFLAASLLTQALLALSITGSPVEVRNSPITIPLTRRLNFFNNTTNLLQHDKARIAALRNYNIHGRRADMVPVSYNYYGYNIAVGVGSPPTTSCASTPAARSRGSKMTHMCKPTPVSTLVGL